MKVLHEVPYKLVEMTEAEGRRALELLKKLSYTYKDRSVWTPSRCSADPSTPDGEQCIGDFSMVNNQELSGRRCEVESTWHFEPDHLCKILPLLWEQADKLQAFKEWIHTYLDSHNIPHHPPGSHGAAGCRIGDRMDWLMEKLRMAEG